MAHPNLLIFGGSPDDAIAADVVEQEEPGTEGFVALLAVPDEEAARQVAPGDFDAPILVRQEHKHVAIAREQGRVLAVGDDVLFDPLVGGVTHRPDQDDRAVIGCAKVSHGEFLSEGNPPTPIPHTTRGRAG